ncbi:MAG: aquaporin family protein [Acidobacteria bacterium]|nr:aquaporin family protein [Acidobacteriota bacterium]
MSKAQVAAIETANSETEINPTPTLLGQCSAEFLGTFIVIFVGNGAGAAASLVNQLDGWGVAMMWGLAVTFGIYVAGSVSGAHFNPAVTITMAVFRGFPKKYILPFIASQIAGAYVASACLYFFWHNFIAAQATKLGVVIGEPGSQKLMSLFSCFYPSPGVGTDASAWALISLSQALTIEVVLTAFLLVMIFALTEPENTGMPQAGIGAWFIGLTVTAIVGIGGNLTMDAVNPVRDFAPRLFAYTIGFGKIAFPGPRGNEWWLYIVAPIIGGLLGAFVYRYLIHRFLPRAK